MLAGKIVGEPMRRQLLAAAAAAALVAPCRAAPLVSCPVGNGQTTNYDILRGGAVIGHQTTHYTVSGQDMTVTVDVNAALHALGVRVYHYEHHEEEQWRAGQMVHLASTTDDNGTPRHVDATRDPQTGAWRGITGTQPGPGPMLSTSLWNNQTVSQTRLLDRETGEVVPVHVGAAEPQEIQLGQRHVTASKYDLAGPMKGTVWYDPNGCWVQALFHTRVDGSLIEVRAK